MGRVREIHRLRRRVRVAAPDPSLTQYSGMAAVTELVDRLAMIKLLDVAMALALRPKLLIMDEPTSGVASEDKFALMETVMHALDERRVTSWFVEHDVDIVSRYATRVAAWIAGKVAADGSPSEVLNNPQIKSEVLGA